MTDLSVDYGLIAVTAFAASFFGAFGTKLVEAVLKALIKLNDRVHHKKKDNRLVYSV